jgi:hypothetical protein
MNPGLTPRLSGPVLSLAPPLRELPIVTNGGFEDVPGRSPDRVTDRRIARTIDRHGTASGGSAD